MKKILLILTALFLIASSLTPTNVKAQSTDSVVFTCILPIDTARCHENFTITLKGVYSLLQKADLLGSKNELLNIPVDEDIFAPKLYVVGNGTVSTKVLLASNGSFKSDTPYYVGRIIRTFMEDGKVICTQKILLAEAKP